MNIKEKGIEASKLDELRTALLQDVKDAAELWHERQTAFSRRAYVRSAFSFMDGITHMMKDAALLFDNLNNPRTLTSEEVVLLKDEDPYVKDDGTIGVRSAKIGRKNNFRLTVRCYVKVFGFSSSLDVKIAGWQSFVEAAKIRDRITHPKSVNDLLPTDDDMELVANAMNYFMDQTAPLLQLSKRLNT